ncbi:MAG TPA: lipopolysaccharide assembly protein LapA domain-containing protein [Acidimicrobiales bacterium]|nr:lipopolysaccharide assembly protein LapA domain-containing protein [Acidimicrobiales bacterium]
MLPALVLLAVTVVFVVQNLRSAKVSFFTVSGHLPLGVALLAAAALGALVVLALGSVRIFQLRSLVRRTTIGAQRRTGTNGDTPS